MLNSGTIDLLDDDKAINQIVGLERRTARGGRESIDHGPGGHDDVANAIAGAASLCRRKAEQPQAVFGHYGRVSDSPFSSLRRGLG
jgi:hypothetical protein